MPGSIKCQEGIGVGLGGGKQKPAPGLAALPGLKLKG